ncbi:hypothetical protein SBFV3_gp01 [Sulfolobales Beppu filamentous virus 3]|uniref:Uncharacterized protein n=1 Tax=Sulfolobales Beppu filamentous virus 3 TaxID=2493124 RepID=A0A3S8NEZ5_9VIRU|nr:hypothetical protein HOU83_gp01 [Sulfolobales Beppu filamentous virus 3]AZI75836.1 hypothetical protein SBFV3_gp01 [Sulfolobales Beppu filamentous virus 3]
MNIQTQVQKGIQDLSLFLREKGFRVQILSTPQSVSINAVSELMDSRLVHYGKNSIGKSVIVYAGSYTSVITRNVKVRIYHKGLSVTRFVIDTLAVEYNTNTLEVKVFMPNGRTYAFHGYVDYEIRRRERAFYVQLVLNRVME